MEPSDETTKRREFLDWVVAQGFDPQFLITEAKIPRPVPGAESADRLVALMCLPNDAAVAVRLRFGCLPLPAGIAIPEQIDPERMCWLMDE